MRLAAALGGHGRVRAVVVLAALLVALGGTASAQPRRLDPGDLDAMVGEEPPQVILLTFGVGARIFEKFGHAAICLNWRDTGREPVCFNYGVTDFNAGSEMIWNFLRTQQTFWVDPEAWSDMIGFYTWEDRDIYEQVLPLSPDQARAVEKQILTSLDEAHRYYHYDHFFDNCTTRVRDMIDRATGGALRAGADVAYPLTFRQIGRRGLAGLPPLLALADFVLGRQLDDTPTLWEAMFHPDVLRQAVQNKLGVAPRLLHVRHGPPFPTDGSMWRWQVLAIALVFALPLLVATWRRRFQRLALAWATLYLTLWGVIVWGLVIVSSIPGVRWNENVFVLMPLDIVLPFLSPARRRTYARIRLAGLFLVSALAGIGVFHQPLWMPVLTALLPLAIIAFDQKIASPRG